MEYTAENNWGELKQGEESKFTGTKYSSRPTSFGKPATFEESLEVITPEVTIGGHVFVPKHIDEVVDGGVIGKDGKLPAPPEAYFVLTAKG